MYSPRFLFQSFYPAMLNFYYAYAQKPSASNDTLSVYASSDCGGTWNRIFELGGADLSTAGTLNAAFFPASLQYSLASVDLSPYANQDLYLRFEFKPDINGPGNNVFIDDIMVSGVSALPENRPTNCLSIFPNPVKESFDLYSDCMNDELRIELFDVCGKKVLDWNMVGKNARFYLPTTLDPGLYFLRLKGSTSYGSLKLIKVE